MDFMWVFLPIQFFPVMQCNIQWSIYLLIWVGRINIQGNVLKPYFALFQILVDAFFFFTNICSAYTYSYLVSDTSLCLI